MPEQHVVARKVDDCSPFNSQRPVIGAYGVAQSISRMTPLSASANLGNWFSSGNQLDLGSLPTRESCIAKHLISSAEL